MSCPSTFMLMLLKKAKMSCPSTFMLMPDISAKESLSSKAGVDKMAMWLKALAYAFRERRPMTGIQKKFVRQAYRLYLKCECCLEPQGSGYTVEAEADWVARLLPAMQVALVVGSTYEKVTNAGVTFFPNLPIIPDKIINQASEAMHVLHGKSTPASFAIIQTKVETAMLLMQDKQNKSRSWSSPASQKQLATFLEDADRQNIWGGLYLIEFEKPIPGSSVSGESLWVCPKCISGQDGGCIATRLLKMHGMPVGGGPATDDSLPGGVRFQGDGGDGRSSIQHAVQSLLKTKGAAIRSKRFTAADLPPKPTRKGEGAADGSVAEGAVAQGVAEGVSESKSEGLPERVGSPDLGSFRSLVRTSSASPQKKLLGSLFRPSSVSPHPHQG
eukprot:gene31670-6872_t